MKIKPQIISLKPYPFDLLVFWWVKKEDIIKWIAKEIPNQVLQNPDMYRFDGVWRTIMTDGGWIILWTKDKDISIMVHEVFHAVEFLYNRIWLTHSIESWEAWAYMMQYITNEILKEWNVSPALSMPDSTNE